MLEHCSWEVASEKEHSMLSVSKDVYRSSFREEGRIMNCDYSDSFGRIEEEGIEKVYHLLDFSRAITNLETGKTHPFPSSVFSIGFS